MKTEISRRGFLGRAGTIGALAGSGLVTTVDAPRAQTDSVDDEHWPNAGGSWAPNLSGNPDPAHIRRRPNGWRVRPTGADDRENLQWALRNAGPGEIVRLTRGTFKLSKPVIVPDFNGALIGAGQHRTTITCTDEFSYEVWETSGAAAAGEPPPPPFPRVENLPGAATKSVPLLISFYKTPLQPGEDPERRANKIVIANLRVRGAMNGELWMFGDEVVSINIINSIDWHNPEVVQQTTRQDVIVSSVLVDGYRSAAFGPWENACACITVLGGLVLTADYDLSGNSDGDAVGAFNGGLLAVTPAEGDITFRNCTFRNCRVGPGAVGAINSRIVLENNTTDGCRGNCLQAWDVSNCRVIVDGNDLSCDSFILPPIFVNGEENVPSSLGCMVVLQGVIAAIGLPANIKWWGLANDEAAHARDPVLSGPLGTWRPQGPAAVPQFPSQFRITNNQCVSDPSINTYCVHIVDLGTLVTGQSSTRALIRNNVCEGSQTCIGIEHCDSVRVVANECDSLAYGVELHNSAGAFVARNSFEFAGGPGCELHLLQLGEKIDISRVVPGAGVCAPQ